ncbi:MAG: Gfo/Idh/MocA family oxidoreductase [Chitinophagaceae bacterium]|nr:Gfo/Idh/MocA family oxidoreductase [Chitinophagaceae bacterium]
MSRLKFAILGCGKIAPRHATEIKKHGELIAVCDIIPEKADQLAKEFGAKAFYHPDELYKNSSAIDVVAVCTPNGLHTEHSITALLYGAHVLCEKPLSISATDGRRMIEVAEKTGKKLFVVKSTRYNPAIASLKMALDEKKLGQLYSFQLNCFWNRPPAYYAGSWRGTELDGGTLFTQFSHYIDALLWLLGDISQVSGFRKNLAHHDSILSEDTGIVALEMQSGLIGGLNWSVNTYRENMEVSLTLIAEKATIELGGGYMNELKYQASGDLLLDTPVEGAANDYGFYKGSMSNHDQVYENLLKALANEQHPFISAGDGLKTVEAIERIYNSVSLS